MEAEALCPLPIEARVDYIDRFSGDKFLHSKMHVRTTRRLDSPRLGWLNRYDRRLSVLALRDTVRPSNESRLGALQVLEACKGCLTLLRTRSNLASIWLYVCAACKLSLYLDVTDRVTAICSTSSVWRAL